MSCSEYEQLTEAQLHIASAFVSSCTDPLLMPEPDPVRMQQYDHAVNGVCRPSLLVCALYI